MDMRAGSGAEEIETRLRQWRQAHPRATFDEIEDAVQQELVGWQARLVGALLEGPETESEEAPPVCAACGRQMHRCGTRVRRVVSRMGQTLPVERAYYACPACGAGLSPPG